jgi:hypothetical protein
MPPLTSILRFVFAMAIGAAATSTRAAEEIVKMDPMRVSAGGYEEFVPTWSFDAKPPRLLLRRAERVRTPSIYARWLVPIDCDLKDGDEIVRVNGKSVADSGFLALWQSVLKDGTSLTLQVRAEKAVLARKVEYVLRTKLPEAAKDAKKAKSR